MATPAARPTATDTNRHKQADKHRPRDTQKLGQTDSHRQTHTDRLTCIIAVTWTAELRSTIRVDKVLAPDFSPPEREREGERETEKQQKRE